MIDSMDALLTHSAISEHIDALGHALGPQMLPVGGECGAAFLLSVARAPRM